SPPTPRRGPPRRAACIRSNAAAPRSARGGYAHSRERGARAGAEASPSAPLCVRNENRGGGGLVLGTVEPVDRRWVRRCAPRHGITPRLREARRLRQRALLRW